MNNSTEITERAYAKINLFLDVTGKRSDGYHNIKTVMHSIPLFDTVTVKPTENISMECTDKTLSCGGDNLCIKAAKLFFEESGISGGCHILLDKKIPMQAGLGGGSSDAAAVLRALNAMYDRPFADGQLKKISVTLGADVPFCINGGSSLAEGIGEILSDYYSLPSCYIVISRGIGQVSTPQAYKLIDSTPTSVKQDFAKFDSAMKSGDLKDICSSLYNRFEDTLPSCLEVKKSMTDNGAAGTLLSGSGSAVFGLFDGEEKAKIALDNVIGAMFMGKL